MSLECWTRRSNLSKICTVGAIHNTLDHQTFCPRNISFCGGTVLCWESVTTNCPCKKVLFQRQDKNEISESSRYTYCFPNSWVAASSCVPMLLITTRSRCVCCPKMRRILNAVTREGIVLSDNLTRTLEPRREQSHPRSKFGAFCLQSP